MRVAYAMTLVLAFASPALAEDGALAQAYKPNPAVAGIAQAASGEPRIIGSSGDFNRDRDALRAEGRVMLGYSSYKGDPPSDQQIIAFARSVGASVVVKSAQERVAGEKTTGKTTYPLAEPFSASRPTSGIVTARELPKETTLSTYINTVMFFSAPIHRDMGLVLQPLHGDLIHPEEVKGGLRVEIVVKGSPAEQAGITVGDIVASVGGQPASSTDAVRAATKAAYGRSLDLVVVRGGQAFAAQLKLSADGSW